MTEITNEYTQSRFWQWELQPTKRYKHDDPIIVEWHYDEDNLQYVIQCILPDSIHTDCFYFRVVVRKYILGEDGLYLGDTIHSESLPCRDKITGRENVFEDACYYVDSVRVSILSHKIDTLKVCSFNIR